MNPGKGDLFLVVGASQSHVPFIQAAQKLGFHTVIFDRDPSKPGAIMADIFYPLSTHDSEGILEECLRLKQYYSVAGIITYSAYPEPLKVIARVAEAFGLNSFCPQTVEVIQNKTLMREMLNRAKVPVPEWIKTQNCEEIIRFYRYCQSPIVVKPASGTSGSMGVSMICRESEIPSALEIAARSSENGLVLVEKFYQGREFSVGGIADGHKATKLAFLEKFNLGPSHNFTISGFAMGQIADKEGQIEESFDSITQVALQAVSAINIKFSFFTVDLLLTEKGPLVLEVGILLDAKVDRLLNFSGIDVYEMICSLVSGGGVKYQGCNDHKGYALKFLFADRFGKLKINLESELDRVVSSGQYKIEWERRNGDLVQPPRSIADTLGWILYEHENALSSFQKAAEISQQKCFYIL